MYKKPKILVVGSFVMDLIVRTNRVPNGGETVIDGLSFTTAAGGKGANQAVQAARLGAQVTMIGKVGKDQFGDQLLKSAQEAGVDINYVLRDEKVSSGIGDIILDIKPDQNVENRIIVVPGANMELTVAETTFVSDLVSRYDMVMLQLEIPMEVNEAVVNYAYEKGIPVMLNSAPPAHLPDTLLSKLTYISPNEHEAAELTGVKIIKEGSMVDLDTVKKAAEALLNKGVKNVIITLGSCGAAYVNKDKFIYKPCVEGVVAVDPTAAGDSFTGAFCTAVCMGMPEEEAVDFANHTAAITVSRMGAQPSLPGISEVKELMQSKNCFKVDKEGGAKMVELQAHERILEDFLDISINEINRLIKKLNAAFYEQAVELILDAEKQGNRLHVTGIGKPGHVAGYVASLLSSTGTPTYELNGTEAVHGSSGQVQPGDVVIAISNSGETEELKATIATLKNNRAKIIAVSGNPKSWLAEHGDAFLYAGVEKEGDPINRAPRASISAEIIVLQGLSVILQSIKGITPQQYVKWHPGGSLGKLREDEKIG